MKFQLSGIFIYSEISSDDVEYAEGISLYRDPSFGWVKPNVDG